MSEIPTILTRASVVALMVALGQTTPIASAWAAEQPQPLPPAPQQAQATAPAPSTPTPAPAAAPAPTPAASLDEMRQQRYQELRTSAAEFGVDLPATPPWESAQSAAPAAPEAMRRPTPQERRAMRESQWQQMREDAAKRGIAMPENPPWVEARKRREEMARRYEEYRKTVDAMSEEQREAARAIFGRAPRGFYPRDPYYGYGDDEAGYGAWDHHCPTMPRGSAYPQMTPNPERSTEDQGPPPPPATGNPN